MLGTLIGGGGGGGGDAFGFGVLVLVFLIGKGGGGTCCSLKVNVFIALIKEVDNKESNFECYSGK